MTAIVIAGAILIGFGIVALVIAKSHRSSTVAITSAVDALKKHVTGELGDARQRIQAVTIAAVNKVVAASAPTASDSQLAPVFQPSSAAVVTAQPAPPPVAAVAAEVPTTKPTETKTMRFTPTFINVVGTPGPDNRINVPWPAVPNVGTIVTVPNSPPALAFGFAPNAALHAPVGRLQLNGHSASSRVTLRDSSGAIIRENAAYVPFVLDKDPPQPDWLRLNTGTAYEITADGLSDSVRFDIYT